MLNKMIRILFINLTYFPAMSSQLWLDKTSALFDQNAIKQLVRSPPIDTRMESYRLSTDIFLVETVHSEIEPLNIIQTYV
jgi:hypothetical protein